MARGLVSQQSLIDTANAIRFSTDDSAKMLPSEMPDNIRSIEGKIVALPKGRVNFYDYDGELLYSYSPKEFIEKGLPDNPRHEGLVAQGWNWDYEEIATQIKEVGGDINVGQMYTTQSGATQIDIELDQDSLEPYLYFEYLAGTQFTVDWGDDSNLIEQTVNTDGNFNQQHIYSQPGNYTIKIIVNQGEIQLANSSNQSKILQNNIINIRIGKNIFSIKASAFLYCHLLKSITIPNSITLIEARAFSNCFSLTSIIIPNSITSIESRIFGNCYSLKLLIIPNKTSSFNRLIAHSCYSLKSITIPNSKTLIDTFVFGDCYSLKSITVPNSITSISSSSFQNCYNILEYHFKSTTPPTLGTNVFTGINQNCKIYVPYSADHSVLNAYKTATNWSTWADYIVEEDAPIEYTMPTPIADRPELFVDVEEAEDGDEVNYSIIMNIIDQEDE